MSAWVELEVRLRKSRVLQKCAGSERQHQQLVKQIGGGGECGVVGSVKTYVRCGGALWGCEERAASINVGIANPRRCLLSIIECDSSEDRDLLFAKAGL